MTPTLVLLAALQLGGGHPETGREIGRIATPDVAACRIAAEAFNAQTQAQRFLSGAAAYVVATGADIDENHPPIDFTAICRS